ncbi:MAG: Nramp family divalent metal transporter [Planctomycetales bacterium]
MSQLPAWGTDDLPEPLPFTIRNVFRTIGPGAILLAASIGGGEWLIGPTAAVKYGTGIFWIATTAIILQLILNLEAIRYTLYTGEPIITGIMRLRPGSRFWGWVYSLLAIVQLSVPALAIGCSSVVFALATQRLPDSPDGQILNYCAYGVIALGVILLASGGKIERTLEILSWGMIAYIFVFLIIVNIFFVPPAHSVETAKGFFQFGFLPDEVDVLLLATLAATAGSGGIGNLTISNWIRDKGFGMGAKVGAIASAFSGEHGEPSHVGKVFPINPENLRRWGLWWRYVQFDQVWLWALGCFVGMYLNVNLATAIIPGDDAQSMEGVAAGAFQANYLAEHYWTGFWILGLLNGFWILFSTHLGNTDVLVRTVTDILWTASSRARAWRGGSITTIYYSLLAVVTAVGLVAMHFGTAIQLFKFLGVVAIIVLALGAVQILIVNRTLLPERLRPSWWRQGALVVCALFYMFVTVCMGYDQWTKVLRPLLGTWFGAE